MDPASMWTRPSIVFLCKPSALFQLPENQCNPTFKESLVNVFLVKCFISVSVVSTSNWKLQRMTFHLPRDRYTVLLPTLTSTRLLTPYQRINTNPREAQNALGPKTNTPNAPSKLLPNTMGPNTQQSYPVQIPFKWTEVHLDQGLRLNSDECCMGLVH